MKQFILFPGIFLILISTIIGFRLVHRTDKQIPTPFETIVLNEEDEESHIKKQEWLEMIHRCSPEENWRQMDQTYRLKNHSEVNDIKELPIYGKWREFGSNNQAGRTVYSYFDQANLEVYTAADGGQIWKGEIGADNWNSINDHFKIPGIRFMTKFYQANFTRLLVHSSQYNVVGVLYSDDDGQNWTLSTGLESIVNWGFIKRTVVQQNANKTIYSCN